MGVEVFGGKEGRRWREKWFLLLRGFILFRFSILDFEYRFMYVLKIILEGV